MTKKERLEAKKQAELEQAGKEALRQKNKKKTIIGGAIITVAIICTLCIAFYTSKQVPDYASMDFDKYIKLGNYKGLEYTMAEEKVTDKDVEQYIQGDLASHGEEKVKDGKAENGDTVKLNFTGTVDGKVMDAACATDYSLKLGSNSMIDGFEDAIVGHKAGDKFKADLVFPKDYSDESVAGKPVKFDMELIEVSQYIDPELNDDFVKKNTEYKTVKEYKEAVRKDLENDAKTEAQQAAEDDLWNQVLEKTEVIKYPKNSVKHETEVLKKQQESELEEYGQTLEEALSQSGMSKKEYNKQMKESAEQIVKNKLIAYAIAHKEKIDISDKAYDKFRKGLLAGEGYTEAQFEKEYGMTFDEYCEENDIRSAFACTKVVEKIRELGKETKK